MKKQVILFTLCCITAFGVMSGCKQNTSQPVSDDAGTVVGGGQSNVVDDVSQKDVVKVAVGSPDHTTLVAALKAAEYVDVLANAGPFTVFAPTNAAFDALPAGTVEDLLKPENKDKLRDILEYHVTLSALDVTHFKDGQVVGMVNSANTTFTVNDQGTFINGAKIIASVRASNGFVHVIDKVLVPAAK